jgi:hypothetical protein
LSLKSTDLEGRPTAFKTHSQAELRHSDDHILSFDGVCYKIRSGEDRLKNPASQK